MPTHVSKMLICCASPVTRSFVSSGWWHQTLEQIRATQILKAVILATPGLLNINMCSMSTHPHKQLHTSMQAIYQFWHMHMPGMETFCSSKQFCKSWYLITYVFYAYVLYTACVYMNVAYVWAKYACTLSLMRCPPRSTRDRLPGTWFNSERVLSVRPRTKNERSTGLKGQRRNDHRPIGPKIFLAIGTRRLWLH